MNNKPKYSSLDELDQIARKRQFEFKKLLTPKGKAAKDLDSRVQALHNKVFEQVDCLACANCCRTIGPRIIPSDVSRIAKYLNINANSFLEQYLKRDTEGDLVFQSMPCPFLGDDNYCSIYEYRPKACSGYPHTDSDKISKIAGLTARNARCCPAVYQILDLLSKR